MMSDKVKCIKEKLLKELIEAMEDRMAKKLKPEESMAVEVAAPDKEKLAEGLDKAKEVVGEMPMDKMDSSEEEDESKLLEMLASEEDDKEEE